MNGLKYGIAINEKTKTMYVRCTGWNIQKLFTMDMHAQSKKIYNYRTAL